MPPDLPKVLGVSESADIKVISSGRMDHHFFARALAKIAYCHAVLRYGLEGFRCLALPDVILGRCPAVAYFVGAPKVDPPAPFPSNVFHMIRHTYLDAPRSNLRLHLTAIRLFAASASRNHGMPIYHVIVGTRSRALFPLKNSNIKTPKVFHL